MNVKFYAMTTCTHCGEPTSMKEEISKAEFDIHESTGLCKTEGGTIVLASRICEECRVTLGSDVWK